MPRHCVFAHTPPGLNPPYLNITEEDDGSFSITVRSERDPEKPNAPADIAYILIPAEVLAEMTDSCAVHLLDEGEMLVDVIPEDDDQEQPN